MNFNATKSVHHMYYQTMLVRSPTGYRNLAVFKTGFSNYQMVLLAQMKRLFSKTQQRFSVFGTCFDVSNIIISHYEYNIM